MILLKAQHVLRRANPMADFAGEEIIRCGAGYCYEPVGFVDTWTRGTGHAKSGGSQLLCGIHAMKLLKSNGFNSLPTVNAPITF